MSTHRAHTGNFTVSAANSVLYWRASARLGGSDLASLRGIPSVSPVPLLAGVRLKGEGCWGAREPAVMDFIFPSSAILRISTKQRKLMYLFSICTAQQVPKLTGIKVIDF